MGVVFIRVRHKPAGGSLSDIYGFSSVEVKKAMKAESSQIQLGLSNKFGKYSGLSTNPLNGFNEDDEVYIYAAHEEINTTNDILLSGTIKEYSFAEDESKVILNITSMDRTYELLKNIYMPGKFETADGLTAPQAIAKIVEFCTSTDGRGNGFDTTNVQTTPTKKDTDPSGTAVFTTINEAQIYKTAYEWITNLSQDPHTRYTIGGSGDYNSGRSYIFFVNENEEFYWKYPSNTVSSTIDLTEPTLNVTSTQLKKSVFDVINMVIYNCGTGPNGKGIEWYYFDETSKITGLNVRVQPMTDISRDLLAFEKTKTTFSGNYPASYPYTTSWGESVANDSEFQGTRTTGFKGECIKRAEARARMITSNSANLRWKGSIELKGTKDYSVGDLLQVSDGRFNMDDVLIRCVGVNHSISENGWFTSLDLEQDESELVIL